MPSKPPSLDDMLDGALNSILESGWDGDPPPAPVPDEPEYPPLPVKDAAPPQAPRKRHSKAEVMAIDTPADVQKRNEPEIDETGTDGVFDIGLLTDLATGRKTAVEAAEAAGITAGQLQSALATALHGMDPNEIAKAMGIQAAEQQLKSGALYGAVLHDLVQDMLAGRLKPEHKLELAKLMAKVGKIEPKEDKGVGVGGGFTLNIQMTPTEKPIIISSD